MNPRGAMAILNNKVKLGVNVSAAAGPKGRAAEADTDVSFRAELLTYSRSRGLFAGISLEGSTLRADNGANESLYGKKLEAADIVRKNAVPAPASDLNFCSLAADKIFTEKQFGSKFAKIVQPERQDSGPFGF